MAQQLNPTPDEIAREEVETAPAPIAPQLQEVATEIGELRRVVAQLRRLQQQPAQLSTIELSQQTPRRTADEHGIETASIGILNPTEAVILIGVGGVPATAQGRALSVPPQSLVVLPLAAAEIEIGTEADLSKGFAIVHLFRYRTVQPAFLGSVS